MSTISLNILKSYPLNNINSDENKVPKNAKIYGVNRIYQSSQCWNRAVKEHYSHGKISAYNTKHVDELTKMICREMELDDDKTNLCVSEITKFITGKDKSHYGLACQEYHFSYRARYCLYFYISHIPKFRQYCAPSF